MEGTPEAAGAHKALDRLLLIPARCLPSLSPSLAHSHAATASCITDLYGYTLQTRKQRRNYLVKYVRE